MVHDASGGAVWGAGEAGGCCAHFGVEVADAHAALVDAEATAALLAANMRAAGSFARVEGLDGADEYLDLRARALQDRVLLDRKISVSRPLNAQRRALEGMATTLGLGADDVVRLNWHRMLRLWIAAVIARDPGSGSGEARKAREYGIPVVGEGVLGA